MTGGDRPLIALLLLAGLWACEPEPVAGHQPVMPPVCQLGVKSATLQPAGFLEGADYWSCVAPRAGAGRARFTDFQGITTVVTGGSIQLTLDWEGAEALRGRMILVGITSERGYYAVSAPSNDNPTTVELYISQSARGGNRSVYFAIDDGTGTPKEPKIGSFLTIPLDVIQVGTGDVQVSLNWDTPTDVDLHVVDPSGVEVYWGATRSSSGGELDLDSNPACNLDNRNNENVYWGANAAPFGEYTVRVDLWAACGTSVTGDRTEFRVTIVTGGEMVEVFDGSFLPTDETGGGAGAGVEIARFFWGG